MGKLDFDPCNCEPGFCLWRNDARACPRCPRRRARLRGFDARLQAQSPVTRWIHDLEEEAPITLPYRKLWHGIEVFAHRLSEIKCRKLTPEGFDDKQQAALLKR